MTTTARSARTSIALAATALCLPALCLPAAVSALASVGAPAEQSRLAITSFVLEQPGGRSQSVHLRVTDGARPRLHLQVSDCDAQGCRTSHYESALAEAAVSLPGDATTGELRTTWGGRALRVVWSPDDRVALKGGTDGSSDTQSQVIGVYRVEPALARITYGGTACTAEGGVGDEVRAELPEGSSGGARPVADSRPAGELACA
jgi:hypothetical protein